MKRILMLCLGNICRSPLAEELLKSKVDPSKVVVESAGTNDYHMGEAPDPRSIAVAKKNGLDISYQRKYQFKVSDFDRYDVIYVMDAYNYNTLMDMARNTKDQYKVELILNELNPGENQNVPDPYYGGDDGFDHVYALLDKATDAIAEKLKNEA